MRHRRSVVDPAVSRSFIYTLPGRRFGVRRIAALPRLVAGIGTVMGPTALRLRRALRDDPSAAFDAQCNAARTVLDTLQVSLDMHGVEHLHSQRPHVIAPLHEGLLDPLVVLQLRTPMVFATRSEFLDWKVLGAILRDSRPIVVDPERPIAGYRTLVRQGRQRLAEGTSVTVFPQGSVLGVETAFHRAAFRLADLAGVPLLPVVITGTHRVWEYPFSPAVRFGGAVRIAVLEPVPVGRALETAREVEREMKMRALAADPGPRRFQPDRDGWWDDYAYRIDPEFAELRARAEWRRLLAGTEA